MAANESQMKVNERYKFSEINCIPKCILSPSQRREAPFLA